MSTASMTQTPPTPPPDILGAAWELLREYGLLLVVQSGLLAWLAKQWRARRSRKAKEAELVDAMAEHCSLSADWMRFEEEYLLGMTGDVDDWLEGAARARWLYYHAGEGLSPRDQYGELRVRKRDSRRRLWRARGFPELTDAEIQTDEEREQHIERVRALRVMKQTGRWQLQEKASKPPGNGGVPE